MHLTIAPFGGEEFGFNSHRYPLNNTDARQALTYVIPRKSMVLAAYGGTDAGGIPVMPPDGMLADMQSLWLTKAQRAKLNAYPVSAAKASYLLRSAGFHKVAGIWHMPNGKPFTLTLSTVSGYSDDPIRRVGQLEALQQLPGPPPGRAVVPQHAEHGARRKSASASRHEQVTLSQYGSEPT